MYLLPLAIPASLSILRMKNKCKNKGICSCIGSKLSLAYFPDRVPIPCSGTKKTFSDIYKLSHWLFYPHLRAFPLRSMLNIKRRLAGLLPTSQGQGEHHQTSLPVALLDHLILFFMDQVPANEQPSWPRAGREPPSLPSPASHSQPSLIQIMSGSLFEPLVHYLPFSCYFLLLV